MNGRRAVALPRALRSPGAADRILAAALALATLLAPAPATAQAPADTARTAAPTDTLSRHLDSLAGRYGRLAVAPHAHGTLVGIALRLPHGSAEDPPGGAGAAHLLAHVRERQAAAVLDPARAALSARVDRNATVYTLLATPEAWVEALGRVDSLVFLGPVPADLVAQESRRARATLRFGAGSPVETFEHEAASLLVDPGSTWAAPVRGTPASLESLDASTLDAWSRDRIRPEEATVALAGPLPPHRGAGGQAAGPTPGTDSTHAAMPAAPGRREAPAPTDSLAPPAGDTTAPPPPRVAWRVGDRVAMVQEVTSAWIGVAWPVPDTLSRTALELLAHLVEEELDPVPPDPDRYSVDVTLLDPPGGPVLQVRASVLPESLARWERRILTAVATLAEAPMEEDFFRWRRRRFRTERLLAEAAPEAEAARMAEDLALLGRARRLDREMWALDAEALLAAARSLGEPRILVLGPDLGQDGS